MSLAAVSETIGLVSGVVGIVSGVAGTLVGVLSYRRQAAQSHPATSVLHPTPAPPGSGATAGRWPAAPPVIGPGLRISVKASLSAVLGIVAVLYAGLVSLAASIGEDAGAVEDAATGAFTIAVVALVLGLLARRDIRRHPERRGKFVSGLGIATAVMAGLVAAAAAQTPTTTSDRVPNLSEVRIAPTTASVDQQLSSAAGAADLVALQLRSELSTALQVEVQERFPGIGVVVDGVSCFPFGDGSAGTCIAQAHHSAGGAGTLSLIYEVVDASTGAFVWRVN